MVTISGCDPVLHRQGNWVLVTRLHERSYMTLLEHEERAADIVRAYNRFPSGRWDIEAAVLHAEDATKAGT